MFNIVKYLLKIVFFIKLKDCKLKMKGGIGWNLRISGVEQFNFCIKVVGLNKSFSANTQPI